MASKQYALNSQDWKKVAVGAMVATVGALLTYLSSVVSNTDFGMWTPVIVSVFSIVANIVRKWLAGK